MRALNVHTAYRHTLKLHSLSDSTTGSTSPPPILPHITCSTCDVKFRANKHLKEHNALKHDESDISTCKVCETAFSSSQTNVEHLHEHDNKIYNKEAPDPKLNLSYKCDQVFPTYYDLGVHARQEHNLELHLPTLTL